MDSFDFHFGGLWTPEAYRKVFNPSDFHLKSAKSVCEFAVIENQGRREYMEDTYSIVDCFAGDPNCGLFWIFDGHGGNKICEFAKDQFIEELDKSMKKARTRTIDISDILRNCFYAVNNALPDKYSWDQGSTAWIVLIVKENEEKVVYIANVGDTRAITTIDGEVKQITDDHNVKNEAEKERIEKTGGFIMNARVGGRLVVTRAFGDLAWKDYGLTVDPVITKYNIDDLGKYLVVWTDGVYDRMTNEEVMEYWKPEWNTYEIWKKIINEVVNERKAKDNWCCWVIKLK